jgi:hypothetical protein
MPDIIIIMAIIDFGSPIIIIIIIIKGSHHYRMA